MPLIFSASSAATAPALAVCGEASADGSAAPARLQSMKMCSLYDEPRLPAAKSAHCARAAWRGQCGFGCSCQRRLGPNDAQYTVWPSRPTPRRPYRARHQHCRQDA